MRTILIGGIFGMSPSFRSTSLQTTTETALQSGLRKMGVEVEGQGHQLLNRLAGADLVHVHHLANGCLQFAAKRRIPLVFTRHATKGLPWHHRQVLDVMYKRADYVVALSEAERSSLVGLVDESRLHVIYNGVDGDLFDLVTRTPPANNEPWRLLYLGQLIPLKRVHLALRMVRYMKSQGLNVRLEIVSHRPRLESELRLLAAELGLAGHVSFLGPLKEADVSECMARSHALLMPSSTEALSTVVTEACLSGLPVLAFNVGGIREQVPPSVSTPSVGDLDAFVRSGVDLATNYAEQLAVYRAHRASTDSRFSVATMVRRHYDLYAALVGTNGA
jgi:glycosyltransferase involved in cell wall biosynthesis